MKTSVLHSSPKAVVQQDPTVEEYKAFHGMLCGISTAKKCIDSFDGCCLFASRGHYQTDDIDMRSLDYSRTFFPLSIVTYYLLVLASLTGLSTVLGQTTWRLVRDEDEIFEESDDKTTTATSAVVSSISHPHLEVPPKVLDYIRERSVADNNISCQLKSTETPQKRKIQLQRRFEVDFGSFLSVIMLHFVCSNGKKHLVEVYSWNYPSVERWMERLFGLIRSIMEHVEILVVRDKGQTKKNT